jgi:hypothetical protein
MTKDADASVRVSAIRSLRNVGGVDATQALIASVGDASPEVERAAMGALAERELDATEMAALADAVTRGGTDVGSDAALVNALAPAPRRHPDARRALAFVLARSDGDLALAARVRGLLNG